MNLSLEHETPKPVVPLHGSVLCVDCECITSGRIDRCSVCGSQSLLNLGHMLDGTPLPSHANSGKNVVRFDLVLTIELKRMVAGDVNTAIDRITRMIEQRLGQRDACFHIRVEPVEGIAEPMRKEPGRASVDIGEQRVA